MLFKFCADVEDGGPALEQHWSMPRVCWVAVTADQQTRVIDTMLA